MVMKFNPQTNRFENTGNTNLTLEQQRLARFQELLRQGVSIPEARAQANSEFPGVTTRGPATTTTTPNSPTTTTPKETGRRTPTRPRGSQENQPSTNPNSPRATTTTTPGSGRQSPTTTVPRNAPTTTVPKVTPTTTVPRNAPTTTTPRVSPTTTAPRVTPTTTPRVSPTTTVPRNSPTTTAPASTTTTVPANPATPTTDFSQYGPIVEGYIQSVLGDNATPEQAAAVAALYNRGGGGGGGSSGPSTAQKKASARIQTQAGKKAQSQYNAMAQSGFDAAQLAAQSFYRTQAEQANTSIDAATKAYLENLIRPTAYSNAAFAQLTPQQQGLMSNLQAYGATGQQAQQQQTQDAEFNRFLTQLLTTSAQSLQTADQGYFDAMRNAGVGGQAAARLGVTQNTAAMQNQSTAQAEAVRQQLIQAGIQALMAGQSNAANTLAS